MIGKNDSKRQAPTTRRQTWKGASLRKPMFSSQLQKKVKASRPEVPRALAREAKEGIGHQQAAHQQCEPEGVECRRVSPSIYPW